jgi:hypothetical protein
MNQVEAQTGITGESLKYYQQYAGDLFKAGWGDSFDAVVQAMSQVRNITQASGDDLQMLTQKALVMQTVFGKDVNESVGTANTLMETFGITGEYAFDLITNGLQKTGDPTGTLLDTMNEFAPIFKDMGFGASEMLSILETGMGGGAKDAQVLGQAMTEFNSKLKDGSSQEAIWSLGLGEMNYNFVRGKASGEDMLAAVQQGLLKVEDPLERNRLGVQLFGDKWNEVGESALLAMNTAGDGLTDVIGATDRAGQAMQRGPRQAWERFTRTVKLGLTGALGPYIEQGLLRAIAVLESLGSWLDGVGIPALSAFAGWIDQSGALEAVASAADWLVGALSRLSPESITLIAVALGAMAAPTIAAGVVSLVGTIGGMAGAIGGAALAAAPLVLILGVVAAYESNFGGLRDKIADIRADFASGDIDGGFQNIAEALISIPKGIVTEVIDPLVGPDLKGGLEAWNGIADNLGRIKDALPGFVGDKLKSLGQDLEDQLVTPFSEKVDAVKGLLTGDGLSSLKSTIRYIPAGLMSWLLDLPGQIYSFLGSPFESQIAAVKGLLTGEGVDGLKAGVSAVVGSLPTWLGGLGQAVLDNLTTPFTDAIVGLIGLITGEDEGSIRATLSALPGQMGDWLEPLGGILSAAFAGPAVAAMNGMMGIIENAINKVIDQINGLAGYDIVEKGLGLLGIEKPSIDHVDLGEVALPELARGGALRGLGITGEEGPELAFANQPTAILSHGRSVRAIQDAFGLPAYAGAGGMTISGPIHLHGVEDPEDFLDRLDRMARRRNKTLLKKGRTNRES